MAVNKKEPSTASVTDTRPEDAISLTRSTGTDIQSKIEGERGWSLFLKFPFLLQSLFLDLFFCVTFGKSSSLRGVNEMAASTGDSFWVDERILKWEFNSQKYFRFDFQFNPTLSFQQCKGQEDLIWRKLRLRCRGSNVEIGKPQACNVTMVRDLNFFSSKETTLPPPLHPSLEWPRVEVRYLWPISFNIDWRWIESVWLRWVFISLFLRAARNVLSILNSIICSSTDTWGSRLTWSCSTRGCWPVDGVPKNQKFLML